MTGDVAPPAPILARAVGGGNTLSGAPPSAPPPTWASATSSSSVANTHHSTGTLLIHCVTGHPRDQPLPPTRCAQIKHPEFPLCATSTPPLPPSNDPIATTMTTTRTRSNSSSSPGERRGIHHRAFSSRRTHLSLFCSGLSVENPNARRGNSSGGMGDMIKGILQKAKEFVFALHSNCLNSRLILHPAQRRSSTRWWRGAQRSWTISTAISLRRKRSVSRTSSIFGCSSNSPQPTLSAPTIPPPSSSLILPHRLLVQPFQALSPVRQKSKKRKKRPFEISLSGRMDSRSKMEISWITRILVTRRFSPLSIPGASLLISARSKTEARLDLRRAPLSLLKVRHDQPVELRIAKRLSEKWSRQPSAPVGPFAGSGNRLGSEAAPGFNEVTPVVETPAPASTRQPMATAFEIDSTAPITTLQLRLRSGERFVLLHVSTIAILC